MVHLGRLRDITLLRRRRSRYAHDPMSRTQFLWTIPVAAALGAVFVAGGLLVERSAQALPPAGIDILNVSGEVQASSRLGSETIPLSGTITVQRDDPRMEGGVEVVDLEVLDISLVGESVTGTVSISRYEGEGFDSTGEIRSLQAPPQQFPASSFFDIHLQAEIPFSPLSQPVVLHNEQPIHLVPTSDDGEVPVNAWPPVGVSYHAEPNPAAASGAEPQTFPPGQPHCTSGLPLLPSFPAKVCVDSMTIVIVEATTPTPSETPTITSTPCPTAVCTPTPTNATGPTPTRTPLPTAEATPTRSPTPTATPTETLVCRAASTSGGVYSDALQAPLSIPDNDPVGVADCIIISETTTIDDLDVAVDVSHTWVGDLVIILSHAEGGGTVTLIERPGAPATGFGCAQEDIDATLDDEALTAAEDACAISPAIRGRLRPNEPLAAFDGRSVAGTWTIRVSDIISGDVGTLNGWSLVVNGAGSLVGDTTCDGDITSVDAALVLQRDAGLLSSLPCDENGDVNGDGRTDPVDALLILQFVAGLLTSLPP